MEGAAADARAVGTLCRVATAVGVGSAPGWAPFCSRPVPPPWCGHRGRGLMLRGRPTARRGRRAALWALSSPPCRRPAEATVGLHPYVVPCKQLWRAPAGDTRGATPSPARPRRGARSARHYGPTPNIPPFGAFAHPRWVHRGAGAGGAAWCCGGTSCGASRSAHCHRGGRQLSPADAPRRQRGASIRLLCAEIGTGHRPRATRCARRGDLCGHVGASAPLSNMDQAEVTHLGA